MANISVWQLLILLLIVVLVFGTKRLKNIGGDLGSAVKGFRKGLEDEDAKSEHEADDPPAELSAADDQLGAQQRERENNQHRG